MYCHDQYHAYVKSLICTAALTRIAYAPVDEIEEEDLDEETDAVCGNNVVDEDEDCDGGNYCTNCRCHPELTADAEGGCTYQGPDDRWLLFISGTARDYAYPFTYGIAQDRKSTRLNSSH